MTGTDLCVNKSQFVPVIFEPPCILITSPGPGLDDPGFKSGQEQTSKSSPVLTQPPIQLAEGIPSTGVNRPGREATLITHLPPVYGTTSTAVPLLPLYAVMAFTGQNCFRLVPLQQCIPQSFPVEVPLKQFFKSRGTSAYENIIKRRLLAHGDYSQYYQLPDKNFRHISRYIHNFYGISKQLRTYSTISLDTLNDDLRNPVWETLL